MIDQGLVLCYIVNTIKIAKGGLDKMSVPSCILFALAVIVSVVFGFVRASIEAKNGRDVLVGTELTERIGICGPFYLAIIILCCIGSCYLCTMWYWMIVAALLSTVLLIIYLPTWIKDVIQIFYEQTEDFMINH